VITRVLLLFGGRSSEHEISCLSARSVHAALRGDRYDVTCVGITREGRWTLLDGVPEAPPSGLPSVPDDGDTVALVQSRKGPRLVRFDTEDRVEILGPVDVCFPVLHGPYGEDGTVQGLLASAGVPYVGADVASSAIGIDKRQMKHVFSARGLPQVPYLAFRRAEWEDDPAECVASVSASLRFPVYTKPARQGSSIGIRRCPTPESLVDGVEEAFGFDRVVIVEQGVEDKRELECGVLGNSVLDVTLPGETIHSGTELYDYQAKYLAPVELRCPAGVPEAVAQRCMDYARQAYLAIGARGMARVDFFLLPDGEVLVNEINTIPGLTPSSMFPPVWAAQGLPWEAVVDRLLALAIEAAAVEQHYAP